MNKLVIRLLALLFISFFLIAGYLIFFRKTWNGTTKLAIAFDSLDGGVRVVVIDPEIVRLTNYYIPKNTSVEVARNLGVWNLGSVWKLGEHEGLGGGRLLTETLTKSLGIPTFTYSDASGYKIIQGEFGGLFNTLRDESSNLYLSDKISILLFGLKVKNADRVEIDLTSSGFLRKVELPDGTLGFEATEVPFEDFLGVFSDPLIASENPRIAIIDRTGSGRGIVILRPAIEVLGGKIVSISKDGVSEGGCTVFSKSKEARRLFSALFDCSLGKTDPPQAYDIVFEVGEDFVF